MPESVISDNYRLDRIERDIAEIKASIMATQASMASLQNGLADRFTPRRETEVTQSGVEARFVELAKAIDQTNKRIDNTNDDLGDWTGRFWTAAIALAVTLITALISLLRTIPAPH